MNGPARSRGIRDVSQADYKTGATGAISAFQPAKTKGQCKGIVKHSVETTNDAMNGQLLNGFHDALIDEGSFLFTSESVGEGHPGEFMAGWVL